MEWVIAALAVVALALAAAASTGWGGGLPNLVDDRVSPELPEGPLSAEDVRGVTFAVVPRGYSMQQVDALLDRLSSQLAGSEELPFVVDSPPVGRRVVYGPQPDGSDSGESAT